MFEYAFQNCEHKFKRRIFKHCKFEYIVPEADDPKKQMDQPSWIYSQEEPLIGTTGDISKKIYFILSGSIHIMNKTGFYSYGILGEGSYFGDISLLCKQPEEFSYYFDPYHVKPIVMLSITSKLFMDICQTYPLSKQFMYERAMKKRKMF